MPKDYRRHSDRRRYPRKTYVPQLMRVPTTRRPLASKYGDELYMKVQKVLPLETINAIGDVFAYMRQDISASSATSIALYDQPEFQPFIPLYSFYEVVGMKAEMSCADTARVTGSGLYAGMAPGLVAAPSAPLNAELVRLPIQTKGNTQGQVFTAYYAFSKDLKKQGAQYAIPTTNAYTGGNTGVVIARMQLATPPAQGTKVGEVKFTWYVRFSTRRYV